MSGNDILVTFLCAIMLFGGLYLNFKSRRLVDAYQQSHKPEPTQKKVKPGVK